MADEIVETIEEEPIVIEAEKEVIQIAPSEVKEILESVKINVDEQPKEKAKRGRKVETVIVDKSLNEEDPEITKKLYEEFSSFMEQKVDILPDLGIKQTISTGIDVVDAVLGGGFAVGSLNIVVGQPGSGKTMLAIQALGQGQKQFKGNLLGSFLDSEEATTSIRLSNLGVKNPVIKPYTDITVEKVFKFLEGLCLFKEQKGIITPSVVVWDSIANTLSQKEREAEDVNQVIGYKARMLSILIPKYVAKLAHYNICLIAVNQLRDVIQMGPFSAPRDLKFMSSQKDMPGGNILKFNAFQLAEMKVKSVITREKHGFDGVLVTLKCVKNKLFVPNVEVELIGSFTSGFSNFWTNYNLLVKAKRLEAGAWNWLTAYPEKKFRTVSAEDLYKEDKEFARIFDIQVKEAIALEILTKNDINL
jgi:RecA/RadA recombinase